MPPLQLQSTIPSAVRYLPVEGFPGYRIGDDGSPWSCWRRVRPRGMTDTWLPLKGSPQYQGHLMVCLVRDRKKFYRFIHQLVLTAFVGPCPEGMECRHLDGNPANNNLWNLRWGTPKENGEDRVRHGTSGKGGESPTAVLNEDDVREVLRLRKLGVTMKDIAERFNVHDRTIQAIMYGRSWTSVTGFPPYKPKSHVIGRRPRQSREPVVAATSVNYEPREPQELTQRLLW